MKNYKHIIFDADQTLIDFFEDERRALRAVFKAEGKTATDGQIAKIRRFSDDNWVSLGLFDVHTERIQREFHALYYRHLQDVVDYAADRYAIAARKSAAEIFFEELCRPATLFPDALRAVEALSARYFVSVATNGIAEMQRGRLAPLKPYLRGLFVSEEIGEIKPSGAFFTEILRSLGAAAGECLMVGDSISSDIAGATAAGIDGILLDRTNSGIRSSAICTVASLNELLEIL